MTNEEAIKGLKKLRSFHNGSYGEYIDMAIKALEAQPTRVDETYLSVKDAISELKAMREHIVGYMSIVGTTAYDMGIEALEAQPCIEDYPTCTECEHYDRDKHYCPRFCQVIKDTLAEAQPTDAVSRTLVHEAITASIAETENPYEMWQRIEALPSVTPQRPKGKWIFREDMGHQYCCSECGCPKPFVNDYYYKKIIGCPYCLADMSGGGEDEDRN